MADPLLSSMATSLLDVVGAVDISSCCMTRTGGSLQHSAATAVSGRLWAADVSSWFMVRAEGPLLRSAATLRFNVFKDEDISLQFGTMKGNGRP
jgi:hypothetical protein